MKVLKKFFRIFIITLIICVVIFPIILTTFLLQSDSIIASRPTPTLQDMERVKKILKQNNPQKMKEGEIKEITVEPNDAFGPYHNELVMEAQRSAFRPEMNLAIGMRLKIDSPSGKVYYGTITKITNEAITIDLNHPLAGKKIIFTVTIITIEKK